MSNILPRVLLVFFFLALVVVFATGGVMSYPKYQQVHGLAEERARIQRRIDEKVREIAEIKAKQTRFNSDREFVESLARHSRRVFPGELVFVFED